MKKLLVIFFSLALLLSMSGSAKAFAMDEGDFVKMDAAMRDATNGYIWAAVGRDDNSIDLMYEDGSGVHAIEGVKTGITDLVGIVAHASDNTRCYYSYRTGGTTLRVVEYDYDTGEVADTQVGTLVANPIMADKVDSAGYPTWVGLDAASELLAAKVWYYNAGYTSYQFATGVSDKYDIYNTGTDTVAHIAYQTAAGSDIYATARDYIAGSNPYTATLVEDLSAGVNVLIANDSLDNSRMGVAYQDSTSAVKIGYYNGATYSVNTVETLMGSLTEMAATLNTANTAQSYVVYRDDGDANGKLEHKSVTRSTAAIVTNVTIETDGDIDKLAYAGSKTNNEPILAYTKSSLTELDELLKSVNGGTPTLLLQEGAGEAIPELPQNNLWKILVAVLALGLVVGIAAFRKKKETPKA